MSALALIEKYYSSRPSYLDGTAVLHSTLQRAISLGSSVLEIGAGPANTTSEFLSTIGAVTGLDISDEVLSNPYLAGARVFDGGEFPFEDAVFDACVSNYALEHVTDTAMHFREVCRVLRPRGVYCFRTPNLWHYVTLSSKLLPHSLHLLLANRLRGLTPHAHDPYPAVYRANTRSQIVRLSEAAGLIAEEIVMVEKEPFYARASRLLFWPALAYERTVNLTERLACFRANMFGVLRKPAALSRIGH